MKNLEKFSTIFFVAGVVFFGTATLTLGIWPAMMTSKVDKEGGYYPTVPAEFKVYYKDYEEYKAAVRVGRDIYKKEACWHCHSQYVRPVGNESLTYGPVSRAGEYENDLNMPQLFGTRRVGPDLSREGGKRTNDWHIAHFYNPKFTVPDSVMPVYTWYYDETTNPPTPKPELIALVAYIQQLGWRMESAKRVVYDLNEVTMPPQP